MRVWLILAIACAVSGCSTKPVKTTEVRHRDTQDLARDQFVAQRTAELQRMGGPFTDAGIARSKAEEEARGRYGEATSDISTTWSWGSEARRQEKQKAVNERLEVMERDRLRD